MVAIIDYGMGNIHSVRKALELLGAKTAVVNTSEGIKKSMKVVLPGVGAFDDALLELKKQGLILALQEHIKDKKIFLGICLGMQILFEESQEGNLARGLGILKGSVKKFVFEKKDIKVPHMGWNQLKIKNADCPLFNGLSDNSYVYFCHSYYPDPFDKSISAAATEYGIDFTSVVWQDNVYGVQFHPEKSQKTGLQILKNFVEL